ncbi:MAG TPA: hypothetical protein VK364_13575 [Hymenobacter sp.]|nr:hypothetical protein [Hymenobacter sp.]
MMEQGARDGDYKFTKGQVLSRQTGPPVGRFTLAVARQWGHGFDAAAWAAQLFASIRAA